MVDIARLRGIFYEHHDSLVQVAKVIGVTPQTMYRRMRSGIFGSDEIETMIKHYDIKDPMPIFFKRE